MIKQDLLVSLLCWRRRKPFRSEESRFLDKSRSEVLHKRHRLAYR